MDMATIQGMADENGRKRNFQLNVTKTQPLLLRKSRIFIQAAFFDVGKTSLLFDSKYQPPSSSTSPGTQMKHFVRWPSQLLYLYRSSSTKHEIYRNCATKFQASPYPSQLKEGERRSYAN